MNQIHGPERYVDQGLGPDQEESSTHAILSLLTDPGTCEHVDLVITFRAGAYEVWAERGMIRFRRRLEDGKLSFEVIETIGENPVADQDHKAVSSCAEEIRAACASGRPTDDPNVAFIDPSQVSYPFAYERIAQLFDSPYAPDLIVSPRCYTLGVQRGQHGSLDCVQSRAPLAFSGPGIRPGKYSQAVCHVDIAPTICKLMCFPMREGTDATGLGSEERGGVADVYLKRQDGRVLDEIVEDTADAEDANDAARPALVYLILFDGLSHSELTALLESGDDTLPNLRRVLHRAAMFSFGSTVNFPSITWPSHSTILTGSWCGHHDIVNPAYFLRDEKKVVAPQAQGVMTEGFLGDGVETLYEAFRRAAGPHAITASIHDPQGRGADHAPLEQRLLVSKAYLREATPAFVKEIDPRHLAEGKETVHREAVLDARGVAQVMGLFEEGVVAPAFVAHEFAMTDGAGHDYGPHGEALRAAVSETDRRLGAVLDRLEERGLFDSTLFVFTSDHGMAAQDTTLGANPVRHLERQGMKVVTCEPMLWLRDMALSIEPAGDGRSARVTVYDNDRDPQGEYVPVAGAEVLVHAGGEDGKPHSIARLQTNELGVAGFATPPDVPAHDLTVAIRHHDFNPRHVRMDGSSLGVDLRQALYGEGQRE